MSSIKLVNLDHVLSSPDLWFDFDGLNERWKRPAANLHGRIVVGDAAFSTVLAGYARRFQRCEHAVSLVRRTRHGRARIRKHLLHLDRIWLCLTEHARDFLLVTGAEVVVCVAIRTQLVHVVVIVALPPFLQTLAWSIANSAFA